MYLNGIVST